MSDHTDRKYDTAALAAEIAELRANRERLKEAVAIGLRYGQIDGSHHRLWVIDQMLRKLLGDAYAEAIAESNGDDDEWDTGIAP